MPRTQIEKLWLGAGAVVGAVLVVVGYFLLISPQQSETSSVRAQVVSAQDRNNAAKAKIAILQTQNAQLNSYLADVQQAKLALPDTSGLPDFLRTLQSIGAATQTSITSLTVGQPQDLSTAQGFPGIASTATRGKPANGSSGTTGSATTASTGKVYGLSITLTVSGSTARLTEFLKQLQSVQPRAVLISTLNETSNNAGSSKGDTTLSLNMAAFVAPASAAEQSQLAAAASSK
jgi:Tfp pilus assembly protein PilO